MQSPDRPAARSAPRPPWWADGRRSVLLVAGVVLLSRLPFLGPGYGFDPDAWRLALAGHAIATGAGYTMSRSPGYPLVEYGHALLWRWGPVAVNLLSALFSALAAACFARLLHRLGSRDHALAAVALAFVPMVYINSASAMDYVWALAFVMASLLFASGGRPVVAGICCGLAIGCRITSGAMLLPLAVLLVERWPPDRAALKRVGMLALAAGVVGGLAFLPVVLKHGPGFFTFVDRGFRWWGLLGEIAGLRAWGTLGIAAVGIGIAGVAAGAAFYRDRRRSLPALDPRHPVAWGLALAIYVLAFLRLPVEAGYLVPTVPFVLLLFARYLHRGLFVTVCAVLVCAPFVDVGTGGIEPGPVLKEAGSRVRAVRETGHILAAAARAPGERIVVVAGSHLPQVEVTRLRLGRPVAPRAEFVYRLNEARFHEYVAEGYRVYVVPDQYPMNLRVEGLDLRRAGAAPLF